MPKKYYSNDNLEFEFEDRDYRIDVTAIAEEYHEPGRKHLSNGDPGYPPVNEFDLISVGATWYLINDEDGSEIRVEPSKRMTWALNDWLADNQDKFECYGV